MENNNQMEQIIFWIFFQCQFIQRNQKEFRRRYFGNDEAQTIAQRVWESSYISIYELIRCQLHTNFEQV